MNLHALLTHESRIIRKYFILYANNGNKNPSRIFTKSYLITISIKSTTKSNVSYTELRTIFISARGEEASGVPSPSQVGLIKGDRPEKNT